MIHSEGIGMLITSFEGVEDSMSGDLLLSWLIETDNHTSSSVQEVDNPGTLYKKKRELSNAVETQTRKNIHAFLG